MDSLSAIYIKGTDPTTKYSELLCTDAVISVLLHSFFYLFVLLILYSVSSGMKMSVQSAIILWLVLVIIMMIGYPLRLWRAKSLLVATNNNKDLTRDIMNNAYATWYFLG
jgi:hypothetical protein